MTSVGTTAPRELTLQLPHLRMRALAWGPDDGRLALCLHGFPDSPWSWRKLGPKLAERGFRVVAPFMRGYAPTEVSADADYSIGALMYDALVLHRHLGAPDDAVLIGHDWGAFTSNAMAAYPDTPFAEHIVMSVPSIAAMTKQRHSPLQEARMGLRQFRMSWYILFFQIPLLPEQLVHKVIPRLWRDWEPPGSDLTDDIANTQRALPTLSHRRAAISYYRALARPTRSSSKYTDLDGYRFAAPQVPVLHVQGALDGAIHVGYSDFLADALPAGSRVHIVDGGGHFLQVQRPDEVRDAILAHLGRPR